MDPAHVHMCFGAQQVVGEQGLEELLGLVRLSQPRVLKDPPVTTGFLPTQEVTWVAQFWG